MESHLLAYTVHIKLQVIKYVVNKNVVEENKWVPFFVKEMFIYSFIYSATVRVSTGMISGGNLRGHRENMLKFT